MASFKLLITISIILSNFFISINCLAQVKADSVKAGSKVQSALQKAKAKCESTMEGIQGSQFGQFVGDGVKYAKDGIAYAKSAYEQGMKYANEVKDKVLNSKEYKAAMISKDIATETLKLKDLGEELIKKQEEIRQEFELRKEQNAAKQKLIQQNSQIIDAETKQEDVSANDNKANIDSEGVIEKLDADNIITTIKKDPITIVKETTQFSLDNAARDLSDEMTVNKEEQNNTDIENTEDISKSEVLEIEDNVELKDEETTINESSGTDLEAPETDASVKKDSLKERINRRKKFKTSYLRHSESWAFAKAEESEGSVANLVLEAYNNQGVSPRIISPEDELVALQKMSKFLEIQMVEKIAEVEIEYAPKIAAQTRTISKKEKELEALYGKDKKEKKEDKKPEEAQKANASKFFTIKKDPKAAKKGLSIKEARKAKDKQSEYVAEENSNDFARVAGMRQEMTSNSEEAETTSSTSGTMPGESENSGVNTEVVAKQLGVLQSYINLMIADLQIQTTFALKALNQETMVEPKGVFNLCDYTDPSNVMGKMECIKSKAEAGLEKAQELEGKVEDRLETAQEIKSKVEDGIETATNVVEQGKALGEQVGNAVSNGPVSAISEETGGNISLMGM